MNLRLVVVAIATTWMVTGVALASALGPWLGRGAEAAGELVARDVSPTADRRSVGPVRWLLPASIVVMAFGSSTGLAAAGVLPERAQDVAHVVLGRVGLDIPKVDPTVTTTQASAAPDGAPDEEQAGAAATGEAPDGAGEQQDGPDGGGPGTDDPGADDPGGDDPATDDPATDDPAVGATAPDGTVAPPAPVAPADEGAPLGVDNAPPTTVPAGPPVTRPRDPVAAPSTTTPTSSPRGTTTTTAPADPDPEPVVTDPTEPDPTDPDPTEPDPTEPTDPDPTEPDQEPVVPVVPPTTTTTTPSTTTGSTTTTTTTVAPVGTPPGDGTLPPLPEDDGPAPGGSSPGAGAQEARDALAEALDTADVARSLGS